MREALDDLVYLTATLASQEMGVPVGHVTDELKRRRADRERIEGAVDRAIQKLERRKREEQREREQREREGGSSSEEEED